MLARSSSLAILSFLFSVVCQKCVSESSLKDRFSVRKILYVGKKTSHSVHCVAVSFFFVCFYSVGGLQMTAILFFHICKKCHFKAV